MSPAPVLGRLLARIASGNLDGADLELTTLEGLLAGEQTQVTAETQSLVDQIGIALRLELDSTRASLAAAHHSRTTLKAYAAPAQRARRRGRLA
ncbi:MAG: hypothetical protein JKY65_31775 [Planctomycetes bacterium]|nr:hypothetical protein [Planctomycetota bacterium]